ncbi:MAG: molybdopterin molybdenumtransferase MoeA, partial [Opitutales bacterium]
MISVTESLQVIFSRVHQLEPVRTSLVEALGRTLRQDARADLDSPPFDASAMDGYALRRADLSQPLRVVGTSEAGTAYSRRLSPGECVRIFTGAPVPEGADGVVK